MIARDMTTEKAATENNQIGYGFLRLKHVLRLIPVCKSTWWAGVNSGRFPAPVRVTGLKATFWRKRDILELLRRLDAGEEI